MMNKKSEVTALELTLDLIGLIAFIFLLKVIASSILETNLDTSSLDKLLLDSRFIYSKEGMIYHDPISKRSYPGLIDTSKFTSEKYSGLFGESLNKIYYQKLIYQDSQSHVTFNEALYKKYNPGKDDASIKVENMHYMLFIDPSTKKIHPSIIMMESRLSKND